MKKIVEICCGSYQDSLAAYQGGADRIELNSALYLGGLSPSLASLVLSKENTDLKVITMVRPRGAGFSYSPADFACMKLEAQLFLENGADGIAFGILEADGRIDLARSKEMLAIIKGYQGEAVFHRAFDCVPDPYAAIEDLIGLGVDRLLTSGLKVTAMEGRELLRDLQKKYGRQIQILAGSGINGENAQVLMAETGICQVHSSCKAWHQDATTSGRQVSYSYGGPKYRNAYDLVDPRLVADLVRSVRSLKF